MSKIEERVMGSVALIYAGRKLVGTTALKFYVLALSCVGLVTLVSISNVAMNFVNVLAHGGVGGVVAFLTSAVLGTTLLVQAALVIATASTVSLVIPVFRTSNRVLA